MTENCPNQRKNSETERQMQAKNKGTTAYLPRRCHKNRPNQNGGNKMKEKLEFDLENKDIIHMDDVHFNAIFNEDLDDDHENIMERVVDHINYRGDYNSGGSSGDADDGTNDDDDDKDDDDDSDEDDESFWRQEFDMKMLVVCTAGAKHYQKFA
ncbi:uncharacterized protein LOC133697317 [Populus nigra]|uniref:uncharacterized protein LOC133697317 n=1 Tax=Populus nigra TaxID=3691 RepID=UPI002B26FA57|nr:uncharacterized protein LOC133697317 [Populus nigra]